MIAEKNINHGIENEVKAISAFEAKTGFTVVRENRKCHLVIGRMCFKGEVDGFVAEEPNAIIEAKCPVNDESVYLRPSENGELELSSDPPYQYYHQVQAYMEALDKEYCYFFDWRRGDNLDIVKVKRDREFFNQVREVLQNYE